MTGQLAGKTAIVTGAASGIGLAITRLYLAEGAEVLAVDQASFDTADMQASDELALLVCDITAPNAAERIVETVLTRFNKVDILVNNAGICLPGTVEDQTPESWLRTMEVNVTAPFMITRAVLPHMKLRESGRIINLGSIMSDFGGPLHQVQSHRPVAP